MQHSSNIQPAPAWHDNDEARSILASFAANPPASKSSRDLDPHNRGMRDTTIYTGSRVKRLDEIWDAAGSAVLDTPAFADFCDQPRPDALIADAIRREVAA